VNRIKYLQGQGSESPQTAGNFIIFVTSTGKLLISIWISQMQLEAVAATDSKAEQHGWELLWSTKYGRHSTTISFIIDLQLVVGVGANKAFDGNVMNASKIAKTVTNVFILLASVFCTRNHKMQKVKILWNKQCERKGFEIRLGKIFKAKENNCIYTYNPSRVLKCGEKERVLIVFRVLKVIKERNKKSVFQ